MENVEQEKNEKNNDLEQKKELILKEIVNKGFNTKEFLKFCVSKKENGDDLENWNMDELTKSINEFQTQHKNTQSHIQDNQNFKVNTSLKNFLATNKTNENPDLLQSSQINKKINENIENVNIVQENENDSKIYKKEINCKILEKNELNSKNISVIIQNPKQNEAFFLSSSYTTYEVYTKEMKWLVHRRYSDFDWLRNILRKFFPRHFIPPIPGKKAGGRRFDLDFIEKRMKFLQIFMDELMTNETFKASEALLCFLKIEDRAQFDRKIKELNSLICSPYVQDMKTLSGKIVVLDDELNEKYYTNINAYFRLQIQIFNRLNYNLKSFYRNIFAATKNLEEVTKDFDTLTQLNIKVQMKPEITKTYEELNIFFQNWKRILNNENEIIKERIKDFFKYQKMENISYLELVQSREEIKSVYKSAITKLNDKKNKLYSYMDYTKWEIDDLINVDFKLLYNDRNYAMKKMCTKETQSVELLHQQFGYANNMNFSQLRKLINKNNKLFVSNLKQFAELFYPSLNDSITLWSTLKTYI